MKVLNVGQISVSNMEVRPTKEFALICRFMKEIGLWKEFKEYVSDDNIATHCQFDKASTKPVRNIGETKFSYWLKEKKHITIFKGNIFAWFQAWVWCLYFEYYDYHTMPSVIYTSYLDKEKKKFKITIFARE